jgi:hypothetical protein
LKLSNTVKYEVIGVMKDFHYSSLHEKIEPVIIRLAENNGAISLRVNTKPTRIDVADKSQMGNILARANELLLYGSGF